MNTNTLTQKSDIVGIVASGLCLVHCLLTPVLFVAKTCSASCCAGAPSWWLWFDLAFLLVSFFAVSKTTDSTSKKWVKYGLWTSWALLALVVFNEQLGLVYLSKYISFIPAISLVGLHIYNLKYCRCNQDACCVD